MNYPKKDGTWVLQGEKWIDMNEKYNNGKYGELHADTSWGSQFGANTVLVAGLRTEIENVHRKMLEEQRILNNVMQARNQQAHDQVAPPQPARKILEKIKQKIEPTETVHPTGRRIKV